MEIVSQKLSPQTFPVAMPTPRDTSMPGTSVYVSTPMAAPDKSSSATSFNTRSRPIVGDFVVVNFASGAKKMPYVGIVQQLCDNGDFRGSFLRQVAATRTTFTFPQLEDICDFGLEEVVRIVPPPVIDNCFHHIFENDPFTSTSD